MVDLSVSISGENNEARFGLWSMYSTRVAYANIDIAVQNINVHIPNDVTVISDIDGPAGSVFDTVDIIIAAFDVASTENVPLNDTDMDGTLMGKSISLLCYLTD